MTQPEERDLLAAAQQLRHEAEPQIDELTRAELSAARRRALDAKPARDYRWLSIGGFVTAGLALALSGILWLETPTEQSLPPSSETIANLDLLATPESPDFFSDLEFYDWLATEADAG